MPVGSSRQAPQRLANSGLIDEIVAGLGWPDWFDHPDGYGEPIRAPARYEHDAVKAWRAGDAHSELVRRSGFRAAHVGKWKDSETSQKAASKPLLRETRKGGISEKRSIFERASLTAIDYVQTLPNEATKSRRDPKANRGPACSAEALVENG